MYYVFVDYADTLFSSEYVREKWSTHIDLFYWF